MAGASDGGGCAGRGDHRTVQRAGGHGVCAYAAIAGFNPLAGLYAGAVPAVVGSLFARTALMVTTLTSAIALTARTALLGAGLDPANPADVAALTLDVGVRMAVFAAVRLEALLRLVSGAAMTGFSVGIDVQITAGAGDDATGYHSPHNNRLVHLSDWFAHIGTWSTAATEASVAAVLVWIVAHAHPRLHRLAILLALAGASVAVAAGGLAVPLAGSLGAIPAGLPGLSLPDWQILPRLLPGAAAVVALAQAAGIPRTVPGSPCGKGSGTADILSQSAANLSGAFFQALPAGGFLRSGPVSAAVILLTLATTQAPLEQALAVALAASLLARLAAPALSVYRNTVAAFSRP